MSTGIDKCGETAYEIGVRILVTGGTGFIGCHCVAALRQSGHEPRLLVRDSAKLERALAPLGVREVEHVIGDIKDEQAVRRALEDCDAAVHAAGMFSDDPRDAAQLQATNVRGTELVLTEAVRAKLDPIIHLSSMIVVFPPSGRSLSAEDPVGQPRSAYTRSKAAAERVSRRLQESGAPVVAIYPGNVHGPFDPTLGQNAQNVMRYLTSGWILVTEGGLPTVDVRDVARLCAAALEPGRGPRRYMLGGPFIRNDELAELLCRLTGRKLRRVHVPGRLLRGAGRLLDGLNAFGLYSPLSYEAAWFLTRALPCDDARAAEDLGVTARPAVESLRDMLRWMYETGALTAEAVGALAHAQHQVSRR
jgi:nucleoside-diphosphate-sugar epimerase